MTFPSSVMHLCTKILFCALCPALLTSSFSWKNLSPFLNTWIYCPRDRSPLVPGAPPQRVRVMPEDSRSLRVTWEPPPARKANGEIIYYKIRYVQSSLSDSDAVEIKIPNPEARSWILEELYKWTEYKIWVLAGTSVGDGPPSEPILRRTDEDGEFTFSFTFHCYYICEHIKEVDS